MVFPLKQRRILFFVFFCENLNTEVVEVEEEEELVMEQRKFEYNFNDNCFNQSS